jgi:hypothetical protein
MRNILCLKCGSKYTEDYVTKLYNMVEKYSKYDYNFYCITDQPFTYKNMKIITLPPYGMQGWWNKPFVFSNLGLTGTNLFLDIDSVICKDMEPLWAYREKESIFYKDVLDCELSTAVIRFEANSLLRVWDSFYRDRHNIIASMTGDQDFVRLIVNDPVFYPDSWLQSYKYQLRGKQYLIKGAVKTANRLYPGVPTIPDDLIIAIIHGHPKNHNITDNWLIENWQ